MQFKYNHILREALNAIDYELCAIKGKDLVIKDMIGEEVYNILSIPTSYTSRKKSRFIKLINDEEYEFIKVKSILSSQYLKNGNDFEISYSNLKQSLDSFFIKVINYESSNNHKEESIMTGIVSKTNYIIYRVSKTIDNVTTVLNLDLESKKDYKKLDLSIFYDTNKVEITIKSINDSTVLIVENNNRILYKEEIKDENIELYIKGVLIYLKDIILKIDSNILKLNPNLEYILKKYYPITEEFEKLLMNSKNIDIIDELMTKYGILNCDIVKRKNLK